MKITINPINACEHTGVDNFHIEYENHTVEVSSNQELKRLANYLGKSMLSSFATSFDAYGWSYKIGDTDLADMDTQIK